MDNCPTCRRGFHNISDFPLVYVADVSVMEPEEVPEIVTDDNGCVVLEKEVKVSAPEIICDFIFKLIDGTLLEEEPKVRLPVLPKDILEQYEKNPGQEMFVSDGYVYKIPREYRDPEVVGQINPYKPPIGWFERNLSVFLREARNEPAPRGARSVLWYRHKNYSSHVKEALESDALQKYFQALKDLEGKEVEPGNLFPEWRNKDTGDEDGNRVIPGLRNLYVDLTDEAECNGSRTAYLTLQKGLTDLLTIGHVKYEGRIK